MRFGFDIHKESLITPVAKVRGGDNLVDFTLFPVYVSVKAFTKWSCFYYLYACRPLSWDFIAMIFHIRGHTKNAFQPKFVCCYSW